MGLSARNGKPGFECDVCGVFIDDFKFLKSCRRCHIDICLGCASLSFNPSDLFPRFNRHLRIEKPSFVCPDCEEELNKEKTEAQTEEENETPRTITTCQLCGSNDEPPEERIFGYQPPTFMNCEKCGKLVCDQCLIAVYDPSYDYSLVCRDCYQSKEQQDAKEREEYWREEEESKIEE
jgi:hypothetical protein